VKWRTAILLGAILFAPGAGAAADRHSNGAPIAAASANLDDEVFYHVFTRSMRDSNGDGEGDLRGIEQSLDYLQGLGVTSILLTPLYPSSFYHNYFASDFEGVDPEFGTMDDYRSLVAAVHARGMKIYLDQEFQYVAYDHPWYRSALGNPKSPYSEFLIFHGPNNTRPEEGPFGITIARRFPNDETGITTVNMKSPKVRAWATDYLLRWVDPNRDGDFSDGVDGFRLDHMMDDLDSKGLLTNLFDDFWKPVFGELRRTNPKLNLIAEQWDWGYGGDFLRRGHVDAAFAFPLAAAIRSFDKARIVEAIARTEEAVPGGKHELVFVENHDMQRIASDKGITAEKLRTAATLAMLLKGVPLIYYGQELGMRGQGRDEFKASDEKDIGNREAFEWSAKVEAPGQANWYKGPKSYWTGRFARDDDGISVAEEDRDPSSLLGHYRKLLGIRAGRPSLRSDHQQVLETAGNLLAVERTSGGERTVIVANLSDKATTYAVTGRELLSDAKVNGALRLEPFQAAVIAQ
jgi:alpha-amylase